MSLFLQTGSELVVLREHTVEYLQVSRVMINPAKSKVFIWPVGSWEEICISSLGLSEGTVEEDGDFEIQEQRIDHV